MTQKRTTLGPPPRIYVASLSDYAMGRFHGRWIDANQDAKAIRAAIASMLEESKKPLAEEWAIHDSENFGGLRLSNHESIETLAEVASLIAEYGQLFAALVEHFGGLANFEIAKRCIECGYRGPFACVAEYAHDFVHHRYGDAVDGLPAFTSGRIDYQKLADEMELSGNILAIEYDGEVYIFSNNY
jgi:antirestriction protein